MSQAMAALPVLTADRLESSQTVLAHAIISVCFFFRLIQKVLEKTQLLLNIYSASPNV